MHGCYLGYNNSIYCIYYQLFILFDIEYYFTIISKQFIHNMLTIPYCFRL